MHICIYTYILRTLARGGVCPQVLPLDVDAGLGQERLAIVGDGGHLEVDAQSVCVNSVNRARRGVNTVYMMIRGVWWTLRRGCEQGVERCDYSV